MLLRGPQPSWRGMIPVDLARATIVKEQKIPDQDAGGAIDPCGQETKNGLGREQAGEWLA